jgi:hypothetical protein
MKELARRHILNGGTVMKPKKLDVKRILKLEGTPPNDEDTEQIMNEWALLKEEMHDFYFQHSSHAEVAFDMSE